MSAKLIGMVFDRYPEGGGEMILALKLADNAHQDGTRIFPSVATMAELTRQSRRTVQYQLKKMVATGWLIRVKEGRGGRGTAGFAAEYCINPAWIKGADFASLNDLSTGVQKKGAKTAPNSEKGASADGKGCKPAQERVQSEAEKGATAIAPQPPLTPIEPSVNPHLLPRHDAEAENGEEEGETPKGQNHETPSATFERLWEVWPSHSGRKAGTRIAALAVWEEMQLGEHVELIVAHVRAMCLTPKWKRGFEPSPVRYLSERWWVDGLPQSAPAEPEEECSDWWLTDSGIGRQGKRVGVERRGPRESTPDYLVRVAMATGRGPWIEYVLKRESGSSRYSQIVELFDEAALLPTDFGS
jgi:hypothetical protein